ncbi:MAG: PH domain-containing protein, partial [Acetobacteraceae bacterium]
MPHQGGIGDAMAYYTKVLQTDETVRAIGLLHWLIFWPAVLWLAVAIAVACVGAFVANEEPQRTYCLYAAAAIAIVAVLMFLGEWLRRHATEIVVTDRRVILKRGLLSHYTVEMNVAKIETVDVRPSIWGRLLNYGTVVIRGTGAGIEQLRG